MLLVSTLTNNVYITPNLDTKTLELGIRVWRRVREGTKHTALGMMHFFGQMRGAVQTRKAPVRVHKADDESNAVLAPPGIVDKGSKDKAGMLVCRCYRRDSDQNDEKGDQRGPKTDFGNRRECLAEAIKEEAEQVDQLIGNKYVPWLDGTAEGQLVNQSIVRSQNAMIYGSVLLSKPPFSSSILVRIGPHRNLQVWVGELIASHQSTAHG